MELVMIGWAVTGRQKVEDGCRETGKPQSKVVFFGRNNGW